jgi:hypothetical protein
MENLREGRNTLSLDKISCHRVNTNLVLLTMRVLAINLLHLLLVGLAA